MLIVRPKSPLMILTSVSLRTKPVLSGLPPHATNASTVANATYPQPLQAQIAPTAQHDVLISVSSSYMAARSFWLSITCRNSAKSAAWNSAQTENQGDDACENQLTDGAAHVLVHLADHLEQFLLRRLLAHG